LVAVIVVSIDRMFEVEIDDPEGIDLAEAMEHGEIVGWRDDAAAIRHENQRFVDVALEPVHAELDEHVCGLFPRATWVALIERAGFEVRAVPLTHDERPVGAEGFLAARPR
jgi:hypothetical protein